MRRAVGPDLGYGIAGALGGLVSSTAVTLTFSRHSKSEPAVAPALARGIVAACTVLPVRVLVVAGVLNVDVAIALAPLVLPVALVGVVLTLLMRVPIEPHAASPAVKPTTPLGLVTAIEMALAFQVALIAIRYAHQEWGDSGTYASGAILGLADMDALTFSTSRSEVAALPSVAAAVIAVGMLANNMMKALIAGTVGTGHVQRRASISLLLMAGVGAAMILLFSFARS